MAQFTNIACEIVIVIMSRLNCVTKRVSEMCMLAYANNKRPLGVKARRTLEELAYAKYHS